MILALARLQLGSTCCVILWSPPAGSPAYQVLRGTPTRPPPIPPRSVASLGGTTFPRGDERASQIPGEPPVRMPCSQTPAGSQHQALDSDRIRTRLRMFRRTRLPQTLPLSASYQQPFNVSMLPSAPMKASVPTKSYFGAQSHGLHTRCLRSAA